MNKCGKFPWLNFLAASIEVSPLEVQNYVRFAGDVADMIFPGKVRGKFYS